jgi:hypothetical protein
MMDSLGLWTAGLTVIAFCFFSYRARGWRILPIAFFGAIGLLFVLAIVVLAIIAVFVPGGQREMVEQYFGVSLLIGSIVLWVKVLWR